MWVGGVRSKPAQGGAAKAPDLGFEHARFGPRLPGTEGVNKSSYWHGFEPSEAVSTHRHMAGTGVHLTLPTA